MQIGENKQKAIKAGIPLASAVLPGHEVIRADSENRKSDNCLFKISVYDLKDREVEYDPTKKYEIDLGSDEILKIFLELLTSMQDNPSFVKFAKSIGKLTTYGTRFENDESTTSKNVQEVFRLIDRNIEIFSNLKILVMRCVGNTGNYLIPNKIELLDLSVVSNVNICNLPELKMLTVFNIKDRKQAEFNLKDLPMLEKVEISGSEGFDVDKIRVDNCPKYTSTPL